MSNFSSLFKRFAKDESGVFAVIFGLMAIVLIALGGAVVDYVSLEQTRSRAQIALDAAALALQPEIFKPGYNQETVRRQAQAILLDRIGDTRITANVETVRTSVVDGTLYFQARFSMPTMFVSLVGVNTLGASVASEATRKKLKLEVVMVLDNSGSMQNESRMTRLIDAAKCATYILMYDKVVNATGNSNTCVPASGAVRSPDVRVGIVPFTMYVNVGASNANAAWIDRTGASAIHFQNFDNDDDEGRLVLTSGSYNFPTRQTLFGATGEAWRGCVEARPHTRVGTRATQFLDTDDTAPSATIGNTLFVPLFQPDTLKNSYVSNRYPAQCDRPSTTGSSCTFTEQRTRNWLGGWNAGTWVSGTPRGATNFTSNALYPNGFYGNLPPGCTCRSPSYTNWDGSTTVQTRTGTCTGSWVPFGLSERVLQERICKYYGGINTTTANSQGPNADCPETSVLPLTDNVTNVISRINAMQAVGGTNIHEGTAWGFRVLSPGEPFTEGGAYGEAISKVMIIMTDGENTAYNLSNHCTSTMLSLNGSCYNSAYGYPYNSQNTNANSTSGRNIERMGPMGTSNPQLVTQMNERTTQTCANAKAAGITVYTIGLATNKVEQSTEAVVKAMLTDCATSADRARFPDQASELKATFESIANDLSALRLAL